MSKTKRQKKQKNRNRSLFEKNNKEIISMIMLSIGILMMISLFSSQMGLVGSLIRRTTFILMGFGGYFLPILFISIGVIFLLERYDQKEFKVSIILSIILLSFIIFLDSRNIGTKVFLQRMKLANSLALSNKGGGIIGSFIGFFFYKLFGKIGGYLVLIFGTMINIMMLREIKIIDIVNNIKKFIGNKNADNKKKQNIKINNESSKEYNNVKKSRLSKKDIKILEYNDKKNIKTENQNDKDKSKQSKSKQIEYVNPPISLLSNSVSKKGSNDKKDILNNARIIEETMKNFGIEVTVEQINRGPTITCYELLPSPGVRVSKIVSLSDNIALSLAAPDIRIEAPIPGKAVVGVEVPNEYKDNVVLKEILVSNEFKDIESNIPLILGKDVSGKPIVSSIDKMPHLLIAGATGSGKSVCINSIITSIIYKSSPEDVKLLLIDPKVVELSVYNDIPHLLIPVVTDAKKSAFALKWAVKEMEKRYQKFAKSSVRDIDGYNKKVEKQDKLSTIVIIIDELADLMMVAAQEIEDYISRLAQMARAAGMYLIVATQRPSVDVITGTIKANIPSRISFAVSSQVDSRTILDIGGAERLLGQGDMLFYPSFYSKPLRIQGTFISDNEVEDIVEFLKNNYKKEYDEDIIDIVDNAKNVNLNDADELLGDAIKLVIAEEQASISMLQRRLRIGYARAARMVDEMEERGIIGGHEGSKPRKVLVSKQNIEDLNDL